MVERDKIKLFNVTESSLKYLNITNDIVLHRVQLKDNIHVTDPNNDAHSLLS